MEQIKLFLEDLNFIPIGKTGRLWAWNYIYTIYQRESDENYTFAKTSISKFSDEYSTGDKREKTVYHGNSIFDDLEFASTLFKNIGFYDCFFDRKITDESKVLNHRELLLNYGFTEISENLWTRTIFLISIQPPKFETDEGKCLILRKPNNRKLMRIDPKAKVSYKGRYFFDDETFTLELFKRIGCKPYASKRNPNYEFLREKIEGIESYIDEEFMKY